MAPKVGRPVVLTTKQVDRLEKLLEEMVDKADGNEEVTLGRLMRKSKVKASKRTVADRLRDRGDRFRKQREKPILTPEDIKSRYHFGRKYKDKPRQWFKKYIHAHFDNHMFKVATTAKGLSLIHI